MAGPNSLMLSVAVPYYQVDFTRPACTNRQLLKRCLIGLELPVQAEEPHYKHCLL